MNVGYAVVATSIPTVARADQGATGRAHSGRGGPRAERGGRERGREKGRERGRDMCNG
jgi:hypothetical protein